MQRHGRRVRRGLLDHRSAIVSDSRATHQEHPRQGNVEPALVDQTARADYSRRQQVRSRAQTLGDQRE